VNVHPEDCENSLRQQLLKNRGLGAGQRVLRMELKSQQMFLSTDDEILFEAFAGTSQRFFMLFPGASSHNI
jgi:hypothetical protein